MAVHQFIFTPGVWIGEGRIMFSASKEHIHYYTKWTVEKSENNGVECRQEVQMQGSQETVYNYFKFNEVKINSFAVELSNDLLGHLKGTGVIDTKTIAWEFRGHPNFEGFEVYELQENGDYMVHAEYASPDQFRTIIDGRVWKKST